MSDDDEVCEPSIIVMDDSPMRAGRLVAVDVDQETIVHDPEDDGLNQLDPIASAVWRALDGEVSLTGMSRELAQGFGVEAERVAEDVLGLVRALDEKRLLATCGKHVS